MGWGRRAVAQVATEVSRIDAGPIPVGMAAAFAHHQQQWAAIARAARHTCPPWVSWPIGVCRGRECGSHQPTHVITSLAHAVHVLHAPGAQQQPACSSDVASEQQRTRTEAIEADATIFVDIGAHHSGNRACGQQLAEHLMAGTAALQWHGRSACADAVRAAISSPFTPAAPHCT